MNPHPPSHDPDDTTPRPAGEPPNVINVPPPPVPVPGPPTNVYPFLSPTDRPGELGRLGPYRVIRLLGEGGMGFVFRAEDDTLRRPVALKVMRPEVAVKPTDRERFLREGRAAASVRSDHVVTIHRVGQENGVPFLDMEFREGLTLEDWLHARKNPVTAGDVLWVARDTLRGLEEAHKQGLIHRDVKPANLWVEADSHRIKLLDFGITRRAGGDPTLTRTGEIVGTPAYMAPEQARGLEVDARTDLFSLGAVLYRMLTDRSPFQRDTYHATLMALALDDPPSVASFGVLPPDLARLIDQLLAKDPGRRPQTASEALGNVLEAARRLLAEGVTPSVPVGNLPVVAAKSSTPTVAMVNPLLAGEMVEEFECMIEGEKKRQNRRVLVLDIGGGQTMRFVRIEKGTFLMGAPDGEYEADMDEKPQKRVEIGREFYLGMHVVTQAHYKEITGQSPSRFIGDRRPVECVSWEDAVAFCERLSERTNRRVELPTESQWEYACRAGTTTPFHFGSTLNGDLANCDGNYPYGTKFKYAYKKETVEVGLYPANPWGLHDMHGNVWEWCLDYHGPYDKIKEVIDPVQLTMQSEDFRVLRGGSWYNAPSICRSSYRFRNAPTRRSYNCGFRVAIYLNV